MSDLTDINDVILTALSSLIDNAALHWGETARQISSENGTASNFVRLRGAQLWQVALRAPSSTPAVCTPNSSGISRLNALDDVNTLTTQLSDAVTSVRDPTPAPSTVVASSIGSDILFFRGGVRWHVRLINVIV